jgi:hypothetical protein
LFSLYSSSGFSLQEQQTDFASAKPSAECMTVTEVMQRRRKYYSGQCSAAQGFSETFNLQAAVIALMAI